MKNNDRESPIGMAVFAGHRANSHMHLISSVTHHDDSQPNVWTTSCEKYHLGMLGDTKALFAAFHLWWLFHTHMSSLCIVSSQVVNVCYANLCPALLLLTFRKGGRPANIHMPWILNLLLCNWKPFYTVIFLYATVQSRSALEGLKECKSV